MNQKRIVRMALGLAASCLFGAAHADEVPQYGGTLNIGNVYMTVPPLTFDNADWNWKFNQDMGLTYELLFAADLKKSRMHGGPYDFTVDAWVPPDALRGELAQSWKLLDNPPGVDIELRRGVMFPAKKGVMEARELSAEDVVYTFNRYNDSPKRIERVLDHIEKVEATGSHSVRFTFKRFNAEWDYRFGWGYYNAIVPKEVVEKGIKNWRNANGTGPYALKNYVQGNTLSFVKNKDYWDSIELGGKAYKLPFADAINYRYIKDPSTFLTALRTAKLDILETVPWTAVEELKKNAPQLQWKQTLSPNGNVLALRVDQKPFDDVRVRRALNMAVDRQQIMASFFGGHAALLAYPMHPQYGAYHEPLDDMPDSIRELFTHNPQKAKALLAEAGYPDGLRFTTLVSSATLWGQELLAMIAAQLAEIGVTMEIQVMEYPAFLSAMTTRTHPPGYFMSLPGSNPIVTLHKAFYSKELWNPSQFSDPQFDAGLDAVLAEPDEAKRTQMLRALNRHVLEAAPHIWLPTAHQFTAWWPWVKNYDGQLRAGAERPGPIHARIWVDQKLKKELGF